MALDRGRLARIDRRLYAEVDDSVGSQMVRVPVSDAVWSSWRRYCELLNMSMGEAIDALISAELMTVVDDDERTASDLVEEISRNAEERSTALDARQRRLDAQAETLRQREKALKEWEKSLQSVPQAINPTLTSVRIARNEPCPCGSGFKYKRCHGRPL